MSSPLQKLVNDPVLIVNKDFIVALIKQMSSDSLNAVRLIRICFRDENDECSLEQAKEIYNAIVGHRPFIIRRDT